MVQRFKINNSTSLPCEATYLSLRYLLSTLSLILVIVWLVKTDMQNASARNVYYHVQSQEGKIGLGLLGLVPHYTSQEDNICSRTKLS